MDMIAECVRDVVRIANFSEDIGQTANSFPETKKRIERLFSENKAQHHGHRAVAQRVRDQLDQAYGDQPMDAKECIDKVIGWLDEEHLERRRLALF
jgi:hypothetical protein